MKSSARSIKR